MKHSIIHIVRVVPPGLLSSFSGGVTVHPVPIAFSPVELSTPWEWAILLRMLKFSQKANKFKQGKVKCLESAAIDSPPQKIIAYLWVWEKVPT